MLKLFKTYNKGKDLFVRPKIKIYFGLWNNMPYLPIWRRGNRIKIAKFSQYYTPKNYVMIKEYETGDIKNDGSIAKYPLYTISRHKLPKGTEFGVWRRDIRKKLKKYKLEWIKPNYLLPLWLSFYIFNLDVMWKYKYDYICYEFAPQFTLVFFGLALTITLNPILEDDDYPDFYWESLLNYVYNDCDSVEDLLYKCGKYGDDNEKFQLKKTYIKPKFHKEYDMAVMKYNNNINNN